ncbi:MAG: hypothetical protein WB801_10445 [Candidatus Dormiibacterota bacterium]
MKRMTRRGLADWSARVVFVVAVGIGWWAVGWPGADHGQPQRLLYSGLVVVAAFIVAAMVQRVIVAEYAIKAGPFEIETLAEAAEVSVAANKEMDERVTALEEELTATQELLATTLEQLREAD